MIVPLCVALLGLALYIAPTGKGQELGRILFFIGAFWLCYNLGHSTIRIG